MRKENEHLNVLLKKERKELLLKMDKGEKVSNVELGMFDLTPYYKNENFDCSLTEKILFSHNDTRRIQHISEKKLFFAPEQQRALEFLHQHNRVILSAPTSFGKTMIVKEYIYLYEPTKIVYIVPTNALAYELVKSFKENAAFSDYSIFDRISDEFIVEAEAKLFFIGTQERYMESRNLFDSVDLFVIDEAYKLDDKVENNRTYILSQAFLDAVIGNVQKTVLLIPLGKIEGFTEYRFEVFQSDYNAVDRVYHIVDEINFYHEMLRHCENEKTILYCSNPSDISKISDDETVRLAARDDSFIQALEEEVDPEWSVVKLLKKGILTHHGQMPKYVQNKMINKYNSKKTLDEAEPYNLLVGTNSISEGINTISKNVFIHFDCRNNIETMLLKNTVGRAGRLGVYPIGHIFSCYDIESSVEDEIEVKLGISDEEEMNIIEESSDDEKIRTIAEEHQLDHEFIKETLNRYSISLSRLSSILRALRKDYNSATLPKMVDISVDAGLLKGYEKSRDKDLISVYLNDSLKIGEEWVDLNTFREELDAFIIKQSANGSQLSVTNAIDHYMKFVYSDLPYSIMPVVNVANDIIDRFPDWGFGDRVRDIITKVSSKYMTRVYGNIDYYNLSTSQQNIVDALQDYGMSKVVRKLNGDILQEIDEQLNVRYSTLDIMNAIRRLAESESPHRRYYADLVYRYL